MKKTQFHVFVWLVLCVSTSTIAMNNANFNPSISLILNGSYYNDTTDGSGNDYLEQASGINEAHNHGGAAADPETKRGFNLNETELVLSASVDTYFDAYANIAILRNGTVDLEEAWFETRALPGGLKVKAGKMRSGIGYQNGFHKHAWDFLDAPLNYLRLLGDHGIADTGVQFSMLPQIDTYWLIGAELFQGDQEVVGALVEDTADLATFNLRSADAGPRLFTLFTKVAPAIGDKHELQIGAFYLRAKQHQEAHEEGEPEEHGLEGDVNVWGLDFVLKRYASGNYGQGSWKLQGEYLFQQKDLTVTHHVADPGEVGALEVFKQDGLYLQFIYGIAPRWEVGGRYDLLGMTNKAEGAELPESSRLSGVATFRPSEFSHVRMQLSRADIETETGPKRFGQFFLQYVMSLGAHGAHTF